jgi:hypothetical protein
MWQTTHTQEAHQFYLQTQQSSNALETNHEQVTTIYMNAYCTYMQPLSSFINV